MALSSLFWGPLLEVDKRDPDALSHPLKLVQSVLDRVAPLLNSYPRPTPSQLIDHLHGRLNLRKLKGYKASRLSCKKA